MNKTPEEILNECATIDGQTIQEFCLKAMLQYGKQQYNQAIKDAAENVNRIALDHQSICFTKDSILKLLNP